MADEAGTREGEAELRWVPAANREIHPAKPAGWSRVGVPSRVLDARGGGRYTR